MHIRKNGSADAEESTEVACFDLEDLNFRSVPCGMEECPLWRESGICDTNLQRETELWTTFQFVSWCSFRDGSISALATSGQQIVEMLRNSYPRWLWFLWCTPNLSKRDCTWYLPSKAWIWFQGERTRSRHSLYVRTRSSGMVWIVSKTVINNSTWGDIQMDRFGFWFKIWHCCESKSKPA